MSSIEMVDLALQLSILMYFVGYLVLLNRNQDIEIDYFYARLPPSVRRAVDRPDRVGDRRRSSCCCSSSPSSCSGWGFAISHPVFPIPQAVVTLPAVLGSAGGLIVAIRKALDVALRARPYRRAAARTAGLAPRHDVAPADGPVRGADVPARTGRDGDRTGVGHPARCCSTAISFSSPSSCSRA